MRPRLYEVLDVEIDASTDEIRRAYRKLALLWHPDKAGPAGAEKFKEISYAHSILSDPKKRAVYNKHGERGLDYASNDLAAPVVDAVGMNLFILLGSVFAVAFAIFGLVTLSLIAAKVDGSLFWSWGAVLFPVWIVQVILMSLVLVFTGTSIYSAAADGKDARVRTSHFFLPAVITGYFFATMLTAIQLEQGNLYWTMVMTPCAAAEALIFLRSFPSLGVDFIKADLTEQGFTVPTWTAYWISMFQTFADAWRFGTFVLVGLRGDSVFDLPWTAVFSPVWIFLLCVPVHTWIVSGIREAGGAVDRRGRIAAVLSNGIFSTLLCTSVLLLTLKADGVVNLSAGACLIPGFLVGCGCFVGAALMCCMSAVIATHRDGPTPV